MLASVVANMLVLVILRDDIPVMHSDWRQQASVSCPAHSIRFAPALDSAVIHFYQYSPATSCRAAIVCLSSGELLTFGIVLVDRSIGIYIEEEVL